MSSDLYLTKEERQILKYIIKLGKDKSFKPQEKLKKVKEYALKRKINIEGALDNLNKNKLIIMVHNIVSFPDPQPRELIEFSVRYEGSRYIECYKEKKKFNRRDWKRAIIGTAIGTIMVEVIRFLIS